MTVALDDREMLGEMPREKLLDLFFLQIRNIWRVDGLYFLGIEERFGTQAATEIDRGCWRTMARLEARALSRVLGLKADTIDSFMALLRNSSWALDLVRKEVETSPRRGLLRVVECRTQNTRVTKGLGEFPCKPVRQAYLEGFAKELNPEIQVRCVTCPPDEHPPGTWCEWEFTLSNGEGASPKAGGSRLQRADK